MGRSERLTARSAIISFTPTVGDSILAIALSVSFATSGLPMASSSRAYANCGSGQFGVSLQRSRSCVSALAHPVHGNHFSQVQPGAGGIRGSLLMISSQIFLAAGWSPSAWQFGPGNLDLCIVGMPLQDSIQHFIGLLDLLAIDRTSALGRGLHVMHDKHHGGQGGRVVQLQNGFRATSRDLSSAVQGTSPPAS